MSFIIVSEPYNIYPQKGKYTDVHKDNLENI